MPAGHQRCYGLPDRTGFLSGSPGGQIGPLGRGNPRAARSGHGVWPLAFTDCLFWISGGSSTVLVDVHEPLRPKRYGSRRNDANFRTSAATVYRLNGPKEIDLQIEDGAFERCDNPVEILATGKRAFGCCTSRCSRARGLFSASPNQLVPCSWSSTQCFRDWDRSMEAKSSTFAALWARRIGG